MPLCDDQRTSSLSFVQSEAVAYLENGLLESSNFACTFTPVGSTTTPDMTPLCTSGRKLSDSEKLLMIGQTEWRRKNRNFSKSRPIAIKPGRLVDLAKLSSKIYISYMHARTRPQRRFEIVISTFRPVCGRCACIVHQARAAICYGLCSQPTKVSLAPTLPFWCRS